MKQALSLLTTVPLQTARIAAALWAALIIYLLVTPSTGVSLGIWQADKVVHAGLFFIQAFLLWNAIVPASRRYLNQVKSSMLVVFTVSLFGIITELIQAAATRTADPFDALADIAGAMLFVVFAQRVLNKLRTTRFG